MKVRTRFAPSPTGSLHIGGIRSALYPYALAKRFGGQFILRIEDTDQKRKVENGEQYIMDALKAYGLEWDEFYRQSDRLDIYKEYAQKLVDAGAAYYSFETKEQLEEARKLAAANKQIFQFRSPDRDLSAADARTRADKGESYVIRLKTPPDEDMQFEDAVQGKMSFNTRDIDDTVLLKSDGFPTYHLAVVVDDHLMEITHVLRGFGWIPSIPKHILIHRAFGWEMPVYGHLTDILNPDGKGKLSKRFGAVAALSFIEKGYLPEAVLNFLMLLGWSSPEARVHGEKERELFTLLEFVEIFDLKDLNKSNQRFDQVKLDWFNQKYLQNEDLDKLVVDFTTWLTNYGENEQLKKDIAEKGNDFLKQTLELVHERSKLLADLPVALGFFYARPPKADFAGSEKLKQVSADQVKTVLEKFSAELEKQAGIDTWGHEGWEQSVRTLADELTLKAGDAFMVLRMAMTGSEFSPPLFEAMVLLGKTEVLSRIKNCL
jgi:glutamyl-tRNA synthetase